ncbi:hypothetical protein GFM02_32260 [Rhizobium leguminosarum bv. viciae]|nr:hypothetical protein [Rhizobium leguminosarum bv. viciae]
MRITTAPPAGLPPRPEKPRPPSAGARRPVDHPIPFEPTECFNLTPKGSSKVSFGRLVPGLRPSCAFHPRPAAPLSSRPE